MDSIVYNNLFEFTDIFPSETDFTTFINSVANVTARFDVTEFYTACVRMYKGYGAKHSTHEDFKDELTVIWNQNIFRLNRKFDLLSVDYDYLKNVKTTRTESEDIIDDVKRDNVFTDTESITDDIKRDVVVADDSITVESEKPQFDNLDANPTRKVNQDTDNRTDDDTLRNFSRSLGRNQDDDTLRNFDRDVSEIITRVDLTTNEQISQYMELYERFNLYAEVLILEDLFLEIFIIR